MKVFKGRVVTPGQVTAEAVVTTEGFNTLASFQNALQFGTNRLSAEIKITKIFMENLY